MRGRPVKCPYCKSTQTISKGYRYTATLGNRRIRQCKQCGKRFTLKARTNTLK